VCGNTGKLKNKSEESPCDWQEVGLAVLLFGILFSYLGSTEKNSTQTRGVNIDPSDVI
jgi:hypothetical protein